MKKIGAKNFNVSNSAMILSIPVRFYVIYSGILLIIFFLLKVHFTLIPKEFLLIFNLIMLYNNFQDSIKSRLNYQ